MAFGTDDEKALMGGFNETFERATRLLCEIRLRKNIDTKLVSMDIKGESKQSIMDDIFGRKIGSVFESGLLDAGSAEEFTGLLESLEKKWSLLHLGDNLAKMTNDQRKEALSRVHHIGPEEAFLNSVASVNKKLVVGESAVFQRILSTGIDWITPDVLKLIAHKGEAVLKEEKVTELPAASAYDTLIIPSNSKPTKPHISVVYLNGKVECQDCQGYSASYLCAHAVAASLKRGTLEVYLKWLVANKRNTGGLNYSRAIAFGMPTGRDRKGERQPRSRRGKQTTSMVIPRNPLQSAPSIGANEYKNYPDAAQLHELLPASCQASVATHQAQLSQLYPAVYNPPGFPFHGGRFHHPYASTFQAHTPQARFQAAPPHRSLSTPPGPSAAAGAWHSGLSPHSYYLGALPKNVKKCYSCSDNFSEKFRQPPHNIMKTQ